MPTYNELSFPLRPNEISVTLPRAVSYNPSSGAFSKSREVCVLGCAFVHSGDLRMARIARRLAGGRLHLLLDARL